MIEFIFILFVGLLCIFLGLQHRKGNIKSLHSYHRHRVLEKDRIPFGRVIGLGTIIIGCTVILASILSFVTTLTDVANIILIVGLSVGLIISFYAMIKYNKGVF